MFERIVAAIDRDPGRSARVIEATMELARAFASSVLVAQVRDERRAASVAPLAKAGAIPPALHFENEQAGRDLVNGAVRRLRAHGVHAEGHLGPGAGATARELVAIANASGATVIVIGDRSCRVIDALLGSVPQRVAQLAKIPVLLVH